MLCYFCWCAKRICVIKFIGTREPQRKKNRYLITLCSLAAAIFCLRLLWKRFVIFHSSFDANFFFFYLFIPYFQQSSIDHTFPSIHISCSPFYLFPCNFCGFSAKNILAPHHLFLVEVQKRIRELNIGANCA